jgi:hypothetical protein
MGCKLSPSSSSQVRHIASAHLTFNSASYTVFLTRALLKSRSGSQRPDNIVNCLIRSVIQIGLLGTIWALAGLTTWFFMRRAVIYEIFDLTVGSIYTHVGVSSIRYIARYSRGHRV